MKEKGSQIFIDLETTGLNANQDRICQIGVILDDGTEIDTLVNPEIQISNASTAIHGITNEMVADAPKLADIADQLIEGLEKAEIFVAYNFSFDFQFLQTELYRTVHYDLNENDFAFIDPYKIFRKQFPHTLSNAYRFYTGKDFDDAHSAIHDIRATREVLEKQKSLYKDLFAKSPKEIEMETIGDTSILGKWFENKQGNYIFKQGKHRGEVVDPRHNDYLKWIYSLEDITLSERRYISEMIGARAG